MHTRDAYRMGQQTAACGFFFDGMEIVAAVSPHVPGGVDALRGALELLFRERDAVNASMASVSALVSAAFSRPTSPPTTVDGYRELMQAGVFEIVNRWSYIADIKQVTRLQAWFYAGFGLGRAETVVKGVRMFTRLRDVVPDGTPLQQMPDNLRRMAAEAARQIEVAAAEDDLRSVRPLFEDAARRARRVAVELQAEPSAIGFGAEHEEDLRALADTGRKITLDLAR